MATVSALFDMNDRITNKLQRIDRNFKKLEKIADSTKRSLDRLDKTEVNPTLDINDKATKKLYIVDKGLNSMDRTTSSATLGIEDKATRQLMKMEAFLKKLNSERAEFKVFLDDNVMRQVEKVQSEIEGYKAEIQMDLKDKATKRYKSIVGMVRDLQSHVEVSLDDNLSKDFAKILKKIQKAELNLAVSLDDKDIKKSMKDLGKSIKGIAKDKLNLVVDLKDEFTKPFVKLIKWAKKQIDEKLNLTIGLDDKLSQPIKKLNDLLERMDMEKVFPTADLNDKASDQLDQIDKKLEDVDAKKVAADVDVNDQATSKLENINSLLDGITGAMATVTAGAGLTLGNSVSGASSSGQMDAKIAATTGMEMPEVTGLVDQLYYEEMIGRTRDDVALSTRNLAQQTDLMGEKLKEAVNVSNMFAELAEKDISEVDRAMSSVINNKLASAQEAGDAFAYIFKNAGDQADDLLDTFNEYSSTFVDMGMNINQVSSAFVAGTKGGARNFDEMADAFREFNIRRTEMTDDQITAYKKLLGSEKAVTAMYKGFKDGSVSGQEALFQVAQALSKIPNEVERAQLATTLIGTKYEDLKQPILDMATAINEPINATGELKEQFDLFHENNPFFPIAEAGRALGKVMKDTGKEIIEGVAPAFEKLNTWMKTEEGKTAIANLTTSVTTLAVAFGQGLAGALQWTIQNWGTLQPILITVGALFSGLWTVVKIGLPIFNAISGAIEYFNTAGTLGNKAIQLISGAFSRLIPWITGAGGWILRIGGIVIRFIPQLALLGAVVTAGIAIWKNWDKIYEYLAPVMDWVGEKIDWAKGKIKSLMDTFEKLKGAEIGMPKWLGGNGLIQVKPGVDGSHAEGISDIPFDGYTAELHKGETVLPREEAEALRSIASKSGSTTTHSRKVEIQTLVGQVIVQNEADEDRLIAKLRRLLEEEIYAGGEVIHG